MFADHRLAGKVIRVAFASAFFEEFWKMIFVISGVIKQFEYSQALYIMKDHHDNGENVTARQCLKESSLLMNGYKEDFFILQLSYFGWQILGMLPLFIGMLWVNSYMEIGMMIFYDDSSKERAVRPVTVFFPDGTNIERDIRINNKVLTRANWIALGYEIVLLGLGIALATFAPGVKTAIQNNTYLIDMKDSMGLNSEYYVKFYTDNENQDDEIDSYIIIPAGKGHENRTIVEKFKKVQKNNPAKFDKQMHQAYHKGVRYTVDGDQLDLESKNTTLKLSDLKVQNKGKKITGNYKFESIDDYGKVSMTKLSE